MKSMTVPVLLLVATLATPALAEDRPINERRPLKPDAQLNIDNLSGLVEIEAWDKPELLLTGTLSGDAKELQITGSDSALRIVVKFPKVVRNPDPSTLTLKVPAGIDLDVEGVSADIRARGLTGPIKVDTVSGDVALDVKSRKVSAGTVSGDIRLNAPAEEIRIGSVSGDVSVRGVRGEVRGENVSGDLRIEARAVRELDVETVSGDLELDLELLPEAEVDVETLSGQVALTLPALPEGAIEIDSFSGELESDWPLKARGGEFRQDGSGKGSLSLSTFSGDVILKKR